MGFLEAVGGFFTGAAETIAGGAKAVYNAAKSVYLFASEVFDRVGGAWDWMLNGLSWIGDNLVGLAARVWHLLEWLALHALPEGLSWAFTQAARFARRAVHVAQTFLEGLVHAVAHWVLGELRRLWHWIEGEARRIWHTLAEAWNFVETVGKRTADLVLHPDKLVAWIIGALVLPLVRWLISFSAPIVVWLVKRAVSLMPQIAHTIEDALAKLI